METEQTRDSNLTERDTSSLEPMDPTELFEESQKFVAKSEKNNEVVKFTLSPSDVDLTKNIKWPLDVTGKPLTLSIDNRSTSTNGQGYDVYLDDLSIEIIKD